MKVYTRSEIIKMLDFFQVQDDTIIHFINKLEAIELPSDEEIEEQSWGYREVTKDMEIPPNEDWYNGAKWMIDKIQGGNQ